MRPATGGLGLDAVLLCASSTSLRPARARRAPRARPRPHRRRRRDVPVDVDRAPLYEKELELRMSRSYGPGRYDRDYEERGRDLPAGYVRWTEQRNMQAFLELVAAGRSTPSRADDAPLPDRRCRRGVRAALPATEAASAPFGVLLEYRRRTRSRAVAPSRPARRARRTPAGVGADRRRRASPARRCIPALQRRGRELVAVASEGGLTAADVAARFGFERAAASVDEILADDAIDAVVIATRHASHAALAAAALRAGKAVFVEKPLALTRGAARTRSRRRSSQRTRC